MNKEQAIEIIERHIDNNIASGSLVEQALNMAIDALKAQLFQESTTSDLISRTETVKHLQGVLEATVPITDYDEGFIDGVEFGISTVSTIPSAQPVTTDTNVGDTIYRKAAVELAMKYCPDDDGSVQCDGDIRGLLDELENLPPAQPDLDEWCTDCREYDKGRHSCPRWNRVIRQTVEDMKAAQPEPAIPLSWIEGQIEQLNNTDNYFAELTANIIKTMLNEWRKGEQK